MKKYTPKEELFKVLNKEDIGYFPRAITNWVPVSEVMKSIGQASLWDVFYKPEEMARLSIAIHEVCNWNSMGIGWAATNEMQALGCEISIGKDGIKSFPVLKNSIFDDPDDIKFKKNIINSEIFKVLFEATRVVKQVVKEKYNDGIPIFASVIGPLTITGYMIGMDRFFKLFIKNPKKVKYAFDVISDLNVLYANEILNNGADIIHFADPVAQGLNDKLFREFLIPGYQKISNSFKDVKIICHICGKTDRILEALKESGFHGFSFDYPYTSFERVSEIIGKDMAVVGSVPTITHMLEGTREDVFNNSLEFIKKGVDILSGSCCPPLETPLDNLRAMADAIEYWNKKEYGLTF